MKKEGNQNRANQMKPNNRVCYQSRRMMSGKPLQKVNQLLNISNQMKPDNSAYHQPRGMATGAPCQNKNTSQKRSNQINPNNLSVKVTAPDQKIAEEFCKREKLLAF